MVIFFRGKGRSELKEYVRGPWWGPPPTTACHVGVACPGGCCPPGAPPSEVICTKNSHIFRKKSYQIFRTFRELSFLGHFLLHGKTRKQTKQGILFYLTNKNRKLKIRTKGSAHQIHQLYTSQKMIH
jgi:hypothetical protein